MKTIFNDFFYGFLFFLLSFHPITAFFRAAENKKLLYNKTVNTNKHISTFSDLSELLLTIEKMIPKNEECAVFKYPQDARLASFTSSPLQVAQQNPIYAKILGLQGHPHSVFINTVCFTHHSLGNDFGFYIESLLCAMKSGTNYIAPYFVDPHGALQTFLNQKELPFLTALPKVVVNPEQLPVAQTKKISDSICKTDMFCWEDEEALMHNNTDVVRHYFRLGVEAFMSSLEPTAHTFKLKSNDRYAIPGRGSNSVVITSPLTDKRLLRIQTAKDINFANTTFFENNEPSLPAERSIVVGGGLRGGTGHIAGRGLTGRDGGGTRSGSVPADTWSFPLLPEVAIHYRCGDNTELAGLLPYRAFDRILTLPDSPNSFFKTIYILSEDSSRHKTPSPQKKRCHKILSGLHQHIASTNPKSTVLLLRGHDLFVDLARLTYANITICSASTFCLWPAISTTNVAYLPVSRLFRKGKKSDYGEKVKWIEVPSQIYFNHKKEDNEIGWNEIMASITKDTKVNIAN